MRIYKKFLFLLTLSMYMMLLTITSYAAAGQATTKQPEDKQILPFYAVRLEWNDVSNEHHYLLSIRNITNGDSGPLIYESQYIAQNSTYFVIPVNKLTRGGIYRWSLSTVDAAGNRTFSPNRHFKIEYSAEDTHFLGIGYASASHIDYFISVSANHSAYDPLIEEYVNSWNGISSNVYLHRDYTNTTKELGIYENLNPPNTRIIGKTFPGRLDLNNIDPYDYRVVTYTEIALYTTNMSFDNGSDFDLRATTLHEVGHALSLAHTNGVDEGQSPNAPVGNSIAKTYDRMDAYTAEQKRDPTLDNVHLVMNKGSSVSGTISNVDKAHLKIKWGD
ncbi:MAG: hypothetical protein IJ408_02275 [Clostridia bacterium]|nr:hypothetical protein [Clostridia bacterium]